MCRVPKAPALPPEPPTRAALQAPDRSAVERDARRRIEAQRGGRAMQTGTMTPGALASRRLTAGQSAAMRATSAPIAENFSPILG